MKVWTPIASNCIDVEHLINELDALDNHIFHESNHDQVAHLLLRVNRYCAGIAKKNKRSHLRWRVRQEQQSIFTASFYNPQKQILHYPLGVMGTRAS